MKRTACSEGCVSPTMRRHVRAVRGLPALLVACLGQSACAEEPIGDWMIGTFSTIAHEGETESALGKVRITSDRVMMIEIRSCRAEEQVFVDLPWEPRGHDTIAVVRPDGNLYLSPYKEWRWTRVSCDELASSGVRENGAEFPQSAYVRGDMCLHYPVDPPPPCPPDTECDDPCESIWCDEPPVPCED